MSEEESILEVQELLENVEERLDALETRLLET